MWGVRTKNRSLLNESVRRARNGNYSLRWLTEKEVDHWYDRMNFNYQAKVFDIAIPASGRWYITNRKRGVI